MQQARYFPQPIYSAFEESDNSAIELDADDNLIMLELIHKSNHDGSLK